MTSHFHTTIANRLMTRTLVRGTALAAIGVLIIIFFGALMPLDQLKFWGLPLLIVAILLVAFGLIPYRQLSKLRSNPDHITLSMAGLAYTRRGQPIFTVPYAAIDHTGYVELRGIYGLGIWLVPAVANTIVIHQPDMNLNQLERASRRRFGCDLFLPFFIEEDCSAMQSQLGEYRAS